MQVLYSPILIYTGHLGGLEPVLSFPFSTLFFRSGYRNRSVSQGPNTLLQTRITNPQMNDCKDGSRLQLEGQG